MDKKGSATLTLILVAIVIVGLLVIFLFPKVRIFAIGVAFLISALIMAVKGQTNKTKTVFIVMFIAIGFLILFFGNSLISNTMFGGGLTINSVSKNVDVISSDTDLTGVWWLVNADVGGLSGGLQSVAGTLTPAETQQFTGYQTKFPLSITATGIDETAEYRISNTGTPIYSYYYTLTFSSNGWDGTTCKNYGLLTAKPNSAPACPAGYNNDIRIDVPSGANSIPIIKSLASSYYTCVQVCYKKQQTGVLGDIQPTRITDKFDLTLSANGKTQTQTLTSDDRHKDYIINGQMLASVDYVKNGVSGNAAPLASGFKAYYDTLQNNKWALTSASRYTDYTSKLSTYEALLGSRWGANVKICTGNAECQFATPLAFINDFKSETSKQSTVVANMRTDNLAITQDQVFGNVNDINNGQLIVGLDRQINVPNINIRARADWLGIVISIGKPSITSIDCSEFTAGTTSNITVSVKNIGTAAGNFMPSLTCGTIKQTFTSSSISLNPGEVTQISVPIDAGTSIGGISDTCNFKVVDTGKASNSDTKSVTCKIDKPALCVEGQFYNENNCIQQCVNGAIKSLKCCDNSKVIIFTANDSNNALGGFDCSTDKPIINTLNCQDMTPKFLGYQEVTTTSQTLWSRLGLAKPKETNWCKPVNEPYIVGGALALILGLSSFFILKSKKKIKGKSTKYGKLGK